MADEPGFLPPEPAGPEPDLGERPPQEPPPESAPAGPAGWSPPQGASPSPQPPPTWNPPPPRQGWTPPPPQSWQYQQQGQPFPQQGWAPEPGNGDAVAGFTCSLIAGALLIVTVGLSSVISLATAIFGVVYSRKGRANVEQGKTTKHKDLAGAGFWIGVATLVLSALATLFWAVFAILYATDEEFQRDVDDALEESGGDSGARIAAHVAALAARGALALLS